MEVEVLMSEAEFEQLPAYDQMFEVAALCLDKGYRDTDILHGQDVENLCHSHAGILGVTAAWKAGS